jgi:purine-binding chemotaxis protein CheW
VPRAPEEVLGVVSVRGKVLAMLDLRRRLRLPEPPPTRAARILVLPSPDRDPVALYVDHVLHVQRLADSEIEPPETAFGSECGEHLIGLGRQGGVLLVLIDVEPLLGSWARRP